MRGFCLEVTGNHACFTRPELKVERVSYDVPTPSAARAIFDAIFWKPAIIWNIKRIEVLSPIRFISIRRNEVGEITRTGSSGIFIEEKRQQRAGLILRDVKYRFHAEFQFIPQTERSQVVNSNSDSLCDNNEPDSSEQVISSHTKKKVKYANWLYDPEENRLYQQAEANPDEKEAKYAAMFERRAKKGQYFHHPYLGCREFPAEFRLIPNDEEKPEIPKELKGEYKLGWMLYDIDFSVPENPTPLFYCPTLKDGVIEVPARDSEEVKR